MELEYIYSATVVVREGNTKILCDPWLVDGIYYGSWYMYPKLEGFDYKSLDDITAIYISHIHADHCDEKTMSKLPRVPVFIHKFDTPFLKSKIERMGFEVRELQNGHSCQIGDLSLTIFAADNCDPSACYKFFGCSQLANKPTSTSIDSLCVISNGRRHILNTNDCPYSLSVAAVKKSLERFKNFDLIMTGYSGAGSYPQCWLDCYDSKKVKTVGEKKKEYFLRSGLQFAQLAKARYILPFAGLYTLAGNKFYLNQLRYNPSLDDANKYYESHLGPSVVKMGQDDVWDLETEQVIGDNYAPVDPREYQDYINGTLSKVLYDYETEEEPEVHSKLEDAKHRFFAKVEEWNFESEYHVYVALPDEQWYRIDIANRQGNIVNSIDSDKWVSYDTDSRLLSRILSGPRFAHWNNAEVGSHIKFNRNPDVYERGLHYCMNYFHV